jgi:formylglycine-generating enzyme required for sulfatase activity
VRITRPFYLGKYEVTQAQWAAVMGDNPSTIKHAANPVESVSWETTQLLLEQLSQEHANEGMKFVLPTEAQWEYACRAGTTTAWHCGDDDEALAEFANSTGTPRPVGQLAANPWGLHDMHGNVWEWCADWYGEDYYSHSPSTDPRGSPTATRRVNRGGSWNGRVTFCRSPFRNWGSPGNGDANLGFRLAAVLVDDPSK